MDEIPYGLYILAGRTPVPTKDVRAWGKWFNETDHRVAKTVLGSGVFVSTVFLGSDHSWKPGSQPILFETMVFDESKGLGNMCLEDYTRRYATWEEAEVGHSEVVEEVKLATKTE
jgi:hypothetical protein